MNVAFIGLGNIGAPMARRLLEAGHELTVFDIDPAAMSNLAALGARLAASPGAAASGAEVTGICVRDDAQLRAVAVEGPDAVLDMAPSGSVVLVHSTVRPFTMALLARHAALRSVAVADVAVTGGAHLAQSGDLIAMSGGDPARLALATPVIDAMCRRRIHAGELGAGMALKAANNLVTMLQLLAAHESFRLAELSGVDPLLLREVMTGNGNLTDTMGRFLDFRATGPTQLGESAFVGFQTRMGQLGTKDLQVALDMAADIGIDLPGARAARDLILDVFLNKPVMERNS